MTFALRLALILFLSVSGSVAASAQSSKPSASAAQAAPVQKEDKPAPYDMQMTRLAEVLGSITYLRGLCGAPAETWRGMMGKLLDSDTTNEARRREKLTAAFNRGYRSFAAIHTACTPAARTAEERYRAEGATLATEITARFGN